MFWWQLWLWRVISSERNPKRKPRKQQTSKKQAHYSPYLLVAYWNYSQTLNMDGAKYSSGKETNFYQTIHVTPQKIALFTYLITNLNRGNIIVILLFIGTCKSALAIEFLAPQHQSIDKVTSWMLHCLRRAYCARTCCRFVNRVVIQEASLHIFLTLLSYKETNTLRTLLVL
jgi:hypothetical protein